MSALTGTWRYPGARSFDDSDLDRKLFFGRERERETLLHTVLSDPLMVLYAKSGTGKSSLLKAGLKEALRERGCLPLIARVNDPAKDPWETIFDYVLEAARQQQIEVLGEERSSPLTFFSKLELWRGDTLLMPVLVIDQFEELFTLHDRAVRNKFYEHFASIVRQHARVEDGEARGRLALRVVISIREDYLGNLEELAPWIPNILNTRVRLNALSLGDAAAAIEGPAAIQDETLSTPPFKYSADTVASILKFLSVRSSPNSLDPVAVEPFQLQLICHYVEQLVANSPARGDRAVGELVVDYHRDLGGDSGMQRIVGMFFHEQIAALAQRFPRAKILNLCMRGLISRGRRLSLEEGEIERRFGLGKEALSAMVDCRLLRAEPRLGSLYYELSHDTLVEPIRAASAESGSRRKRNWMYAASAAGILLLAGGIALGYRMLVSHRISKMMSDAANLQKSRPDKALIKALAAAQQSSNSQVEPSAKILQMAFESGVALTSRVQGLVLDDKTAVALSSNGGFVALGRDGYVDVVNRAGSIVQRLDLGAKGFPSILEFSRQGDVLAIASDRTLSVWTIGGKRLAGPIEATAPVQALAVHPLRPILVAAGPSGQLESISYEQNSSHLPPKEFSKGSPVRRLRFSADGKNLLILTLEGELSVQAFDSDRTGVETKLSALPDDSIADAYAWPYMASVNGKNSVVLVRKFEEKAISYQEIRAANETNGVTSLEIARTAPWDPASRGFKYVDFDAHGAVLVAVSNDNTANVFVRADANGKSSWRRKAAFNPLPTDRTVGFVAVRSASSDGHELKAGRTLTTRDKVYIAFGGPTNREIVVTGEDGRTVSRLNSKMDSGALGELTALKYLSDGTLVAGWSSGGISVWTPQKAMSDSKSQSPAPEGLAGDPSSEGFRKRAYASGAAAAGLTPIPEQPAFILSDNAGRLEIWRSKDLRPHGLVCLDSRAFGVPIMTDGIRIAIPTRDSTYLVDNLSRFLREEPGDEPRGRTCEEQGDSQLGRRTRAELQIRKLSEPRFMPFALDGEFVYEREGEEFRVSTFRDYGSNGAKRLMGALPRKRFLTADFVSESEIVAGDSDGALVFWRLANADEQEVRELTRAQAHDGGTTGIAVSADGSRLVSSGQDGRLHVWSRSAMNMPEISISVSQPQELVALDGQHAVSEAGGSLLVHEIGESSHTDPVRADSAAENILAIDPKNRYFVSMIAESNMIIVSDLRTGIPFGWGNQMDDHCAPTTAAISMEGEKIAVGCTDGNVEITSPLFNSLPSLPVSSTDDSVVTLAYDTNRRYLAVGDRTGRISVWNEKHRRIGESLEAYEDESDPVSIALLNEPTSSGPLDSAVPILATSGTERPGLVQLWRFDGEAFRKGKTLQSDTRREIVRLIALSDGRLISIAADSAYKDSEIRLWNVVDESSTALPHPSPIEDVMLDEVGRVQTIDRAKCLRRWTTSSEGEAPQVDLALALAPGACDSSDAKHENFSARFTADGELLVTTGAGGRRIWPANWRGWVTAACTNALKTSNSDSSNDFGNEAHAFCRSNEVQAQSGPDSVLAAIVEGDSSTIAARLATAEAIDVRNSHGRTGLALAARSGRADLVSILLSHGADPKVTDQYGMTLAHHAAWSADARTIRLVLDAGAGGATVDKDGISPAMMAAARGVLHDVPELMRAADIDRPAASGLTVLMVAAAHSKSADVGALIAAGANADKTFRHDGNVPQNAWLIRNRAIDGDSDATDAQLRERRVQFSATTNFVPRVWLAPPNIERWQNEADQMLLWQQDTAASVNPQTSMNSLLAAAKAGDAEALLLVGLARTVGFGTQRDDVQALKDFSDAASLGSPFAEAVQYLSLIDGRGTSQQTHQSAMTLSNGLQKNRRLVDIPLANYLKWIAIDDGLVESPAGQKPAALEVLGRFLQRGDPLIANSLGVDVSDRYAHREEDDLAREEELLRHVANSGDPVALRNLGSLFESKHDYESAINEYRKAWSAQHSKMFFPWSEVRGVGIYGRPAGLIGNLLLYRTGNTAEAIKWLRLSAARGDSDAALLLGWFYEGAFGSAPNLVEAVKYYRQAAAAGNSGATPWVRLRALEAGP